MSGLLLPVLFWKPGCATVPVLEISLAPDGGAATHSSVRRPFEVLDQGEPPLNKQVLRELLPRFQRLEHYPCTFRYPPHDVDQFVDEFPHGLSHLLAVTLAFYALGADQTLGGSAFRDRLAGWTASGYPDKQGWIRPVAGVREKLAALEEEQAELGAMGVPRVRHVLLPEANREDVEPAPNLHFVRTFEEALETVFGKALLKAYARARRPTRRVMAAALALVLLVAGGFALAGHPSDVVQAVGIKGRLLEIRYEDGTTTRVGPFGGEVCSPCLVRDEDGNVTTIVIGLGREDDRPATPSLGEEELGMIVWLERDWLGRWQQIRKTCPFEGTKLADGRMLSMSATTLRVVDLLPESAGPELIAAFGGVWGYSLTCILSLEGDVKRQLWHGGVVSNFLVLRDPTRLVMWGANNYLDTQDEVPWAKPDVKWDRVFFQIDPRKLGGRGAWHIAHEKMPVGVETLGIAEFDWYVRLVPKGHHDVRVEPNVADAPEPGAIFALVVAGHWYLAVGPDGHVIGEPVLGDADREVTPRPDLEDVEVR